MFEQHLAFLLPFAWSPCLLAGVIFLLSLGSQALCIPLLNEHGIAGMLSLEMEVEPPQASFPSLTWLRPFLPSLSPGVRYLPGRLRGLQTVNSIGVRLEKNLNPTRSMSGLLLFPVLHSVPGHHLSPRPAVMSGPDTSERGSTEGGPLKWTRPFSIAREQ